MNRNEFNLYEYMSIVYIYFYGVIPGLEQNSQFSELFQWILL